MQAADAAADLLRVAALDLFDPVRIADKRARRADEILVSLFQLTLRLFRRADEVDRDDGDGDDTLDLLCKIRTPSGLVGCGLEPAVVDVVAGAGDVDRVDAQLFETLCDPLAGFKIVALSLLADCGVHLVDRQTHDQRIVSPAAFSDALDDLAQEAQTPLEITAVLVGAEVGVGA